MLLEEAGGEGVGGEGGGCGVVDGEFGNDLEAVEGDQVFFLVLAGEFVGEEVGVGSTNDKGGHGAAVTKDGFPHVLVDLVDVLVCEGEI